ncbi:hypothetical protein [Alteribacter natronophilus]|uniref:hypothetical protein n=1 Tax=Alteribacter natronophilus TaxID=2583810 RepID=UPI00110F1548|nr:hypothetical protein [Alteribacter natronophilus]TMW73448.1 hypothetical protein FGB90_03870 [Alteribacter natronophilus]
MNSFHFAAGHLRYLLIFDSKGAEPAASLRNSLINEGAEFKELYAGSGRDLKWISEEISSQKNGTCLYAALETGLLEKLETAAVCAGYLPEEIQFIPSGSRRRIFCAHCHHISITDCENPPVQCSSCGRYLKVSGSRSGYWQAYLAVDREAF